MAPCCGLSELKTMKFYVTLLAEFLGTMFLVLVACGSALAPAGATLTLASQDVAATCGATTIQIALGFGFSVATMVWATAHVSGGHINPAVSFGFVVTRKISWIRFIFYVIMQAAGATLGAALLKGLVPDAGSIGTSQLSGVSRGQGFGMELLITFVLVFTVFASVDGGRGDIGGSVPLTIGVSIAMCHLWAVRNFHLYKCACQFLWKAKEQQFCMERQLHSGKDMGFWSRWVVPKNCPIL